MDIASRISEQRERHVLSLAQPHLAPDERVEHWVRIRPQTGRHEGYAFATQDRCVLVWASAKDSDHVDVRWDEVVTWGVSSGVGGPSVLLETDSESRVFRIPVRTPRTAEKVQAFLDFLRKRAPEPTAAVREGEASQEFRADVPDRVEPERLDWKGQGRRVAITAFGFVAVIAGLLMLVVPGPGILVTLLGLAILATEHDWAKDLLAWARRRYNDTKAKFRDRSST